MASLDGGVCTALDIVKHNGVQALINLAGPETVEEAKRGASSSLRAKYGFNGHKNGIHVARTLESAQKVRLLRLTQK